MKKLIVTTLATTAVALGALAQGSIGTVSTLQTGLTYGVGQSDPNTAANWYVGNISLEVFYAPLASDTQIQINAINLLDGTPGGGVAALALMTSLADGFVLASSSTLHGLTLGAVTDAVGSGPNGTGYFNNGIGSVGLPGAATGANAWLAFYAVGTGAYAGYSGVLAFANNTGGNPNASPTPGLPANITGIDPLNLNLDLTPAVPEPATMALIGLGSLSLMLFRRKIS